MPKYSRFCPRPVLLASFLASSILLSYGQTKTTPPAAKPGTKKPATAGATKTTGTKASTVPLELKTDKDKVSYAIGADLASKIKTSSIDIDPTILTQALKDTLSGGKMLMTDDEIHTTLAGLSRQLQAKQAAAAKEIGDKNKKEGEAFLTANKAKEGVVMLASGLQYKILKAGDGPKPAATDTVQCNYRG